MEYLKIGISSYAFAILFLAAYLIKILIRKVSAWAKRDEQPKDRVIFFLLLYAGLGFFLGSIFQYFLSSRF
jgi:hypothetical protein